MKFAKVMFSQVFVHRGDLCPGGSLSRGSLSGGLPYGYVQAVRILLECILVCNLVLYNFAVTFDRRKFTFSLFLLL